MNNVFISLKEYLPYTSFKNILFLLNMFLQQAIAPLVFILA